MGDYDHIGGAVTGFANASYKLAGCLIGAIGLILLLVAALISLVIYIWVHR